MARPLAKGLFTREEQEAARQKAIKEIEAMLGDAPATIGEVYAAIDGMRATITGYMAYMHKTLRKIRPTGAKKANAMLWELGADPNLPDLDEELDRLISPKRGIHPARQIGIPRDPLVAYLFGEAK
ncbi:MAG: hypothetical protein ACRYGO_07480 [Janthinobacterium lividum]